MANNTLKKRFEDKYKELNPLMNEETRSFLLNFQKLKSKELWDYLNHLLDRLKEEFYIALSKTANTLNVSEDEIEDITSTPWDEYSVGLELAGESIRTYPKDSYVDEYDPDLEWDTLQRYIAEAISKIKKEFNITGYVIDFLLELWDDNFSQY